MKAFEHRTWRSTAALVALVLLGALLFWAVCLQRDASSPNLASDSILNLIAASYQTMTTTVEARDTGGSPPALTWKWRHDETGRLVEMAAPGGAKTCIAYSTLETTSGGAAEAGERRVLAYDAQGRLLSADGTGGKVSFSYYTSGMPAEVRSHNAPTIRYVYDVQDRLTEMRVGETVIRYRYDYLNRLAAVATPAGEITYSYYRAANTVIRRLPNGTQTYREYDDEGSLTKLTHAGAKDHIIAEFAYIYRPDRLISKITEKSRRNGERVFHMEYDRMRRLVAVDCQGDGPSHRYVYDSLGNLADSRTDNADPLHFTSTPTGALSNDSRGVSRSDARGHIRQLPGSQGTLDYDFNSAGELASANGQSLRYTYNPLGLLIARIVEGRKIRYLPDPFAKAWQPIWRRDADGTESVVLWDGAVPLVELQGKQVRYRLEDHLGSVRMELDGRGEVTAWRDYTPYGAPEDAEAGKALTPAYAGLFWDPAAKVYLTMARAYDPVTARFLQPDPQIREPGVSKHSHSLYSYCGGDPVNFADRNGAEAVSFKDDWKKYSMWVKFWAQPALKTFWGGCARDAKDMSRAIRTNEFWNSLSQWRVDVFDSDYLAIDTPIEPGQRYDDGTAFRMDGTRLEPGAAKRFFETRVKEYVSSELQKPKYKGRNFSQLSKANQSIIYTCAADKFAENYSDYVNKKVKPEFAQDYYDFVFNMNIQTGDGWSNQDWLTAGRDSKRHFRLSFLSHEQRQWIGKVGWNFIGPRIGQKEFPAGSVFEIPQNNINAVRLNERLDTMPVSIATNTTSGHLVRNRMNCIPDGVLVPKTTASRIFDYAPGGNNEYVDQSGITWRLEPDTKNMFHQLENLEPGYKTYKFVSAAKDGIGSYEAIFVPGQKGNDFFSGGMWLNTGPKQATYNYVSPRGPIIVHDAVMNIPTLSESYREHFFRDVVPHFLPGNDDYEQSRPDQLYGTRDIGPQSKALANEIMSQINKARRVQQQYDMIGGAGRVAGPGGFASLGAHAALADYRSSNPAAPSRVGGIYLGGAGKALEGLGRLKGVAIDADTGKVVLIGSEEQRITLPPLRLEDIVTVFRTVYNHGESPSVTIDPDEKNPVGPIMHVKHGPGTKETYVGWILFECDRIMKAFQLGKDNITREPVKTNIPGYTDTLEAVFFGDKVNEGTAKNLFKRLLGRDRSNGERWERFWIVPAAVNRFDASTIDLSLFNVPLKVNTQKMRWKRGELVDDEKGESSMGAKTFSSWFTRRYDEIAEEVLLTPPAGTGLKGPVPIFHELRRIALITAIAERLRDGGQSMPLWMRDFQVAPFPVSKTTPSMTIEKSQQVGSMRRLATIYGGVNLAPDDKDVHAYSDIMAEESTTIDQKDEIFIGIAKREATTLTFEIPELAYQDEVDGRRRTITATDGTTLSAVVLPGADTLALAPNRQRVTDMVVPIGLGRNIGLTRYYNSFFEPVGEYGKGWTLDLPELLITKVPVKRDRRRSEYRQVFHLISPLGRVDIRFDQTERVEPYGIEMAVAKDHPEIAGIAYGSSEIAQAQTHQVLFRNGTDWHFDDDGRLVLVQTNGTATRYVRDSSAQICQIEGYIGNDAVADIKLRYDRLGRITEVSAQQADDLVKQAPAAVSALSFEYEDDGRLTTVTCPGKNADESRRVEWTYTYEADRLARISQAGGHEVSFGYNALGQLLWEQQGDQTLEYIVAKTQEGTVLTNGAGEGDAGTETWTYDEGMRPLNADLGAGRTIQWQYRENGDISEIVCQDGEPILTRSTSHDGRVETTALTNGPTYRLQKNAWGCPQVLSRNGVEAARITRRPSGTLACLSTGNMEVRPRHHEHGWPNGILVSAPMKAGRTDQWLEEKWDVMGRPREITDSTGFKLSMNYDDWGRLNAFGRLNDDGEIVGAQLTYDGAGRLTNIKSCWGNVRRKYTDAGGFERIEIERQGAQSVTTFDTLGRLLNRKAFDGGNTTWEYARNDAGAALRTIELPNGKKIEYSQRHIGIKTAIKIDLDQASITNQYDPGSREMTITWGERPR